MKILGIDSSGMVASVAIVSDEIVIAEYNVNFKKTHSQTLLPMVDDITNMLELDMDEIDAIAVAAGPGSFTGLRIGSATVKGLAQALNKPVVAIPTVDALAYNLYGTSSLVCPVMDARRNQTYTGIYDFMRVEAGYRMNIITDQCAVDIKEIIEVLNGLGREVTFLGDGVPVFRNQLDELLEVPHSYAPAFMNRQRAAVLATYAIEYIKEGRCVTSSEFTPIYLRLSQAEREQLEKEKALG